MDGPLYHQFAAARFRSQLGAEIDPDYSAWDAAAAGTGELGAVLGHRGADAHRLFLEAYLDEPIEAAATRALGAQLDRTMIVEIGCLAATSSPAMLRLWIKTAAHLSGRYTVAVATLTAPLRRMFDRAGIPIVALAPAAAERIIDPARWGTYYALQPMVCAGWIMDGAAGLEGFRARRSFAA